MYNEQLKKIFIDIFGLDTDINQENININAINEWDSLNHLNLIISIESEFDINIPPEDIPHLYSDFNMIVKYLINKIS